MSKPRIVLADDHAMVVAAFRKLLETECDILATVSDGEALIAAVETLRPDIAVLDIAMPGLNGLEAAKRIKTRTPQVRLVFLTMHEDGDLMMEALKVGAAAYLLKRSAASELSHAIGEVMRNRSYVTPLLGATVIRSLSHREESPKSLTPRQQQLLRLFVNGASMKEAAATMGVSPRTVAFHKYRMMRQIQVRSTAQLIRFAVERHLV